MSDKEKKRVNISVTVAPDHLDIALTSPSFSPISYQGIRSQEEATQSLAQLYRTLVKVGLTGEEAMAVVDKIVTSVETNLPLKSPKVDPDAYRLTMMIKKDGVHIEAERGGKKIFESGQILEPEQIPGHIAKLRKATGQEEPDDLAHFCKEAIEEFWAKASELFPKPKA